MLTFDEPATDKNLIISLHNGASLVPGKVNISLQLEAGQYATVSGQQGDSCLNNVQLCCSGIMIAFYIYITDLHHSFSVITSMSYKVHVILIWAIS